MILPQNKEIYTANIIK